MLKKSKKKIKGLVVTEAEHRAWHRERGSCGSGKDHDECMKKWGITIKNMKINKIWHAKNKMAKNPNLEQRVKWHKSHAKFCACRPIPEKLLLIINKKI